MTPEEIIRQATEAAAEMQVTPRIPVYMMGPMPLGGVWCATCAVLWMGHLSNDPAMQKYVQKAHNAASEAQQPFVQVTLPENDDKLPVLQLAVTVGPSIYSETPMPVCWTHIKPYRFPTSEEMAEMKKQGGTRNPLIAGKAHWVPGQQ